MNKILRNRLYVVIFGFAIFSVILNFVMQRFIARDQFLQSSIKIFSEVEHILDSNEVVIESIKRNFKENCRLRAKIAAELIEFDRTAIVSTERLRELADLLKVEEIHIFDENGTIIGGTVPSSYGISVHDGPQIGFFKDMLLSKDIELTQDLMPNTANQELMQYAAVWMPCKEHFIQIGRHPRHVMEVLEGTQLSAIFRDIVLDNNADIFAVDMHTLNIVASTEKSFVNRNISEFGFFRNQFKDAAKGNNYTIDNEEYFVVLSENILSNNVFLGKMIRVNDLYSNVNMDSVILIFYLVLAAMVVITAISRYLKYYVLDDMEAVNDNLEDITNGNLNTKVTASATPEFVELSHHINVMVDSLKENTRRAFEMCDKLNVPIGLYEYRNGMHRVAITGNLAEILGLDDKKHLAVFANRELYEEKLEEIKRNLVDEVHGIYKLPWAERYIRLEENEYPDATIGVVMDVTDGYMEMSAIARERDTDVLTGLLNRRSFFVRIENLFNNEEQLGNAAMFFVDANKLKYINDAFGHKAGDMYLCAIADLIRSWRGENKVYCRFGGDEFVLFVYGAKSKEELLEAFDDIMYEMSNSTIEIDGEEIRLSFTVGAAFYPDNSTDYHALIAIADENMCRNKGMGITTRKMLM